MLAKFGLANDPDSLADESGALAATPPPLATIFATKSRQQGIDVFDHSAVRFAPVLDLDEVPIYPQMVARGVFVNVDAIQQPGPVPQYSTTKFSPPSAPVVELRLNW